MVFWRAAALLSTAGVTVWTARSLGPERIGISGFAMAVITQITLLAGILPTGYLVRAYKVANSADGKEQIVGISNVSRLIFPTSLAALVFTVACIWGIRREWLFSALLSPFLVVVTSLQPTWLLQAQERQEAQYKTAFYSALIGLVLCAAIVRKDSIAGIDLLVALLSGIAALCIGWRYAGGGVKLNVVRLASVRESLRHAKDARWLYLAGVVIYVYTGLEIPLVGCFLSIRDVGVYRTAVGLCGAINAFLAVIPLLLFPRFIEWGTRSPAYLWRMQLRLAGCIAAGAALVGLAVVVVGAEIFTIVYGAEYAAGGRVFVILVLARLVVVISGIFTWGLWAVSKDRQMFFVMFIAAVVSCCSNLAIIPIFGMLGAAAVNLASEAIVLLCSMYLLFKHNRAMIPRGMPGLSTNIEKRHTDGF